MQQIFLASSFADVAALFVANTGDRLRGATVAFIPTASRVEEVTHYVDAGRRALADAGLQVRELDIATASPREIADTIRASDALYVSGGNTFYLLQELRRSGADRLIVEHISAGKPYVGESAGAIVLAPDIGYVERMDDASAAPDLVDRAGLGVIDFHPLPHHGNPPFKDAVEDILLHDAATHRLCAISNAQAIVVVDGAPLVLPARDESRVSEMTR